FRSGREARKMNDLKLDSVRVVKEHRVVAGDVPVLLRPALDLRPLADQPVGALVDRSAGRSLERDMVQPDAVAVVRKPAPGLRFPEADPGAGPDEIPDRLAALTLDLAQSMPAERPQQVTVERQAALDRGAD